MRDAGDVEHRIIVFERIEAGMVAERSFAAQLAQFDIAFEHDLGIGGNFQIRSLALHHLDRLAAQEAGDHHLIQIGRQRQNRGIHGGRIGADGHGDIHALGLPARFASRR